MSTHYIRIFYGPTESFGLNAMHRPQFLNGLRNYLRIKGHRVDIVPVEYLNYCLVECCGYMMFKCNIRSFCFNSPYEVDPVCKNAVEAIKQGTEKLQRARTYLWIWNLLQFSMFKRNEYSSEDYWLSNLPPLEEEDEEMVTCLECCQILGCYNKKAARAENKFCDKICKTYTHDT